MMVIVQSECNLLDVKMKHRTTINKQLTVVEKQRGEKKKN